MFLNRCKVSNRIFRAGRGLAIMGKQNVIFFHFRSWNFPSTNYNIARPHLTLIQAKIIFDHQNAQARRIQVSQGALFESMCHCSLLNVKEFLSWRFWSQKDSDLSRNHTVKNEEIMVAITVFSHPICHENFTQALHSSFAKSQDPSCPDMMPQLHVEQIQHKLVLQMFIHVRSFASNF